MKKHTKEIYEYIKTEVKKTYDVVVIGGGIAGASAAVSAARNGVSTLLIEKTIALGGLATLGLINKYEPICDSKGEILMTGIPQELLHLSIKTGFNTLDLRWKDNGKRYHTEFNPFEFIINLDDWVTSNGVDILFDTLFCNTVVENNNITYLIVEDKSGRYAIKCKTCIDASGDCDLMSRSGASCIEGENYLSSWAYLGKYHNDENINHLGLRNNYRIRIGALKPRNYMKTLSGENITKFILSARRKQRELVDYRKATFIALPMIAPLRTTRRILGNRTMTSNTIGKYIEDSIGCCGDWRVSKKTDKYEIPFGALFDSKIENVLCAGRCIAAEGDAWEVTRVIPVCALTGQAAGAAASIMIRERKTCHEIDQSIKMLQNNLEKSGVRIHL